ncbi:tetratricopeptide repeat protein [Clostridium baratii]|uniref:TPR repeat-containing protein n=3 Tax=Clostridium baratii TaxID=1561 RepID=A0A174U460_9CLOT|nr:tetratricopeptide repeat protein [Clostridium baratii]CUQ14868.1 TPR repeat-containing protein [Clostridium baratii]
MSNFDKKLEKAENYYKKKHYKEALRICDKVLAKQYNNEKALELEGEIFYKLGKIDEAILNWKINAEYNNNPTAKMRLAETDKSTKEKALSYDNFNTISSDTLQAELAAILAAQEAEAKEKEAKEQEAKEKQAKEAEAREKEAREKQAKEAEAREKEAREKQAKEAEAREKEAREKQAKEAEAKEKEAREKQAKDTDTTKNENTEAAPTNSDTTDKVESNKKKTSNKNRNIAIAVACGVVVVLAAYSGVKYYSNKNDAPQKQEQQVNEQTKELPADFNNSLTKAVNDKNYEDLYNLLSEAKGLKIPADDEKIYSEATKLMQENGVQKFYDAGLQNMKDKKYEDALNNLNKAYTFCDGTYLQPHIIYFIGAANAGLNKPEDAVKYYKEYLEKFPHSDMYTPEILYKLAEYYNGTGNKDEAKKYAQHIENSYPSSPYYNDTIKDILYK